MQSRRSPRWSYGHTVLLLCWMGWIAIYLGRSVLAPLLPVLSVELGLTHAQAGLIESAYLVGYILVKIPAGLVANRIGIKRTLMIGMVGYAASTALNFFAAGFIHLLAFRFLLGVFQGVHLPLANTLLSERFGERQGRAIGFHESGPNVGNSIAFPLAVTIASSLGWRYAFLLLSLPAFALAVVTTAVLRDDRRLDGGEKEENPGDSGEGLGAFAAVLVPLALAHAVYNLCLRALLTFAPSYLVEFRGMGLAAAGFVATIMPAAGFVAKVSSGFIAERLGRRNAICAATCLSGVFIFALTRVPGSLALGLNFMVLGLSLYSFSPTIYASVTSSLPSRLKSIGLGAVTMAGNTVGALSTFIIGFLIDAYGYPTSLTVISATTLVATVMIYAMMGET